MSQDSDADFVEDEHDLCSCSDAAADGNIEAVGDAPSALNIGAIPEKELAAAGKDLTIDVHKCSELSGGEQKTRRPSEEDAARARSPA